MQNQNPEVVGIKKLDKRSMNNLSIPTISFIFIFIFTVPTIHSLPFIVLPGIGDKCSNHGITHFTQLLSNWSGSQGYCIEAGDGSWDSWVMPLLEQTAIVCEKVKKIDELSGGYNIVGLSQGNMLGRGIIEFCDGGPLVKNFISLGGPHAGTASIPFCGEHLAPSGYLKIPTDIIDYIGGCTFLPKVNNEVINARNSTYKDRFTSLENLVLIMFEHDTVLIPKETSWFGYYPDGSFESVLPAQETKLYTEDWIGLRTLDEEGKVYFISVPGNHLEISQSNMQKYIVPYLEGEEVSSRHGASLKPSSHKWSSSIKNFIAKLAGFNSDKTILRA